MLLRAILLSITLDLDLAYIFEKWVEIISSMSWVGYFIPIFIFKEVR